MGHELIYHDNQEPSCTNSGWYFYEECVRCNYTTYEEIMPACHRIKTGKVSIENDEIYPFDFDGYHDA